MAPYPLDAITGRACDMTSAERERLSNLEFRLDKLIATLNASVQIVLEPREIKRQARITGKHIKLVDSST